MTIIAKQITFFIKNKYWNIALLLFCCLLITPQLYHNSAIMGIDAIFHINRFYDAREQLTHNNINFLMSEYGFNQSGRIVNGVYGQLSSYFFGLLLYIAPTLFSFEVLTSFLFFVVGIFGFFRLAKTLGLNELSSFICSCLYLLMPYTSQWYTQQSMTGIGALMAPWIVFFAIEIFHGKADQWFSLAISLALLTQTHLLSALIVVIFIAIIFIIHLIFGNKDIKKSMFYSVFKASVLYVILILNVIYNFILIFTTQSIVSPYTPKSFLEKSMHFSLHNTITLRSYGIYWLVLIGVVLLFVSIKFHSFNLDWKILTIVGILFGIVSSDFFPWDNKNQLITTISSVIQFPSRLALISNICLCLLVGYFVNQYQSRKMRLVYCLQLIIPFVLLAVTVNFKVNHFTRNSRSNKYVIYAVPFKVYKANFSHKNIEYVVENSQKASPDYLPNKSKYSMSCINHYRLVQYELITLNKNHKYTYEKIRGAGDQVKISWFSASTQKTIVPITVYKQSLVNLNGEKIKNIQTTNIGTLVVSQKKGDNTVIVSIKHSFWMRCCYLVSVTSWFIMILIYINYKRLLY